MNNKLKYMKNILFPLLLIALLNSCAEAQSSVTNLDSFILKNRKVNGTVLINSDETGLKLYAVYKNSSLNEIYAISKTGKMIAVTYKMPETIATSKKKKDLETSPIKCKACITTEDGKILRCWEIDCSLLPPPKSPPKQHS